MIDFRNILSDDIPGAVGRALYLPGWGVKGDYSLCNDDSPNVFHLSGTWQIPYGRGLRFGHDANRIANAFLGGWSVNGILTDQNGFPGTVGCPVATTSDYGCVAFLVPGQSLYSHLCPHGIDQFLNPKGVFPAARCYRRRAIRLLSAGRKGSTIPRSELQQPRLFDFQDVSGH